MIDAIRMLEQQHREVEKLFAQIEKSDQAARLPLLEEVGDLLAIHGELEEKIFYPGVRTEETESIIEHSYDDHGEVKTMLALIAEADPESPDFDQTCQRLLREVRDHVEEEEQKLFPLVREICDRNALQSLAGRMIKMNDDLEKLDSPSDKAIEEATLQQ